MNNSLQTALPIIARYYCDDLGVTVVWGGSQACTRNNVIYLPMIEASPTMLNVALGYTAHESAHIKYTDSTVYDKAGLEPPFIGKFLNLLEDIRIEKRMMTDHYSTIHPLAVTAQEVLGGESDLSGMTEAVLLHDGCLLVGRAKLLNQPLQREADNLIFKMREVFGPGRSTKIFGLLNQVTYLPDTEAVYQLTHRILDVLDEDEPEDDQSQQQNQPSPNSGQGSNPPDQSGQPQRQPGDGGDNGSANDQSGGSDDPDAKADGSSAGAGDPGSDAAGPDAAPTAGAATGQGPVEKLKQKILSATEADLDDAKSDIGGEAAKLIAQAVDHSSPTPASVVKDAVGSSLLGGIVVQNGQLASMGLRQVLNGLIQGARDARVSLRRTGSKIDSSRLARVRVGENRIFRQQEPVQRTNAAIEILLDGSASMDSRDKGKTKAPLQIADEATVAILTALEGIAGVTTGAMVFPRNGGHGTAVGILKRHDQRLVGAIQEGRFGLKATGSTPLANAIWPAAGDLLRAKGERKVMFVITDGDPDNADQAKAMVGRCRDSGIDVFAVAFGTANTVKLQDVFGKDKWQFLSDLGELRAALNGLVQQVLTQAA